MEYSPKGIIRSLFPFPTIRIIQLVKSILFKVRFTNSDTRNPVPYTNSNMALLR